MQVRMTIKKKWFDKIKSGEKTIEYREVKPYWNVRLNKDEPITSILFRNGYSKDSPEMVKGVDKIEMVHGMSTDLKIDKTVYAIHLSEYCT